MGLGLGGWGFSKNRESGLPAPSTGLLDSQVRNYLGRAHSAVDMPARYVLFHLLAFIWAVLALQSVAFGQENRTGQDSSAAFAKTIPDSLPTDTRPSLVPGGGLDTETQDQVEQLDDGSLEDEENENGDLERIAESRAYYRKNPIDLNQATFESLSDLGILAPAQIEGILRHREQTGDFVSTLELQAVELMTIEEVRRMQPYVTVNARASAPLKTIGARFRDAEGFAAMRTGYQSTSANRDLWLGPPVPLYIRIRQTAGRQLSVGLVLENDAGERFGGKGNPAGFDYVSMHAYADELPGKIKTIALGDFGVNWGQGLINYSGFGTGKSAFVMNVQRNPRWLIPHASVTETGFFRGAATAVEFGSFRAMALVSRTQPDGTVDTIDVLGEDFAFTTNRLSGLHRTESEIAGRRINTAVSLGGAVAYERSWGRISMHAIEHRFETPFAPGDALYQQFNLAGDRIRNGSLAWQTFLGKVSWFGEAAIDGNRHSAVISGLQTTLDRRTDLSVVVRRYDSEYRSLYANAFGNSRLANTEEGIYIGSRMQIAPEWTLQGFVDVFRTPFARFRQSRPSTNTDALLRLSYEKRRQYSVYFQLRRRTGERDESAEESETIRTLLPYNRVSARIQAEITLSKQLALRSRVEYAQTYESGRKSEGTVVYQDILWKPETLPFSATARIAMINTDDYESRIYAYENDLLYRFRIPAYYGQGTRSYLNLRYRVSRRLTAELRGALGRRRGASDQTEVTTQLRWVF